MATTSKISSTTRSILPISVLIFILLAVMIFPETTFGNSSPRLRFKNKTTQNEKAKDNKAKSIYESISRDYAEGKISTDSVISLALYHKTGNPALAEQCLNLVAKKNPRAMMELGALYAFTPAYANKASEGIQLLKDAANAGYNDANCYLGLYYYNQNDPTTAKKYFDACNPINYGFAYAALGGMATTGNGEKKDIPKARDYYRQSALKGYPRGAALYGFNLRATGGGPINYPDSFFWLYIAGDLGDDAARTTLFLPRNGESYGDSETGKKALEALQWIELVQSGKKIQNEPIYKEGFLPGLKDKEKAAEQGDDWARYYLGSMNYNGDFLNQNYTQALRYYEGIAKNDKLPRTMLAVVHARLAKMYKEGKGTKKDAAKAAIHTEKAAHYGHLPSYKTIEGI